MNPLLAKIQQDIGDKVLEEDKQDFLNAVKAGMSILYNPSTHQNLELVKNPAARKDPVGTISKGIAGLGYVMYKQSNEQMDPNVLIPALLVLMCEIMDFSEQSYGLEITNEMVSATTKEMVAEIFKKLGVKPEHLQEAIAQGKSRIEQPTGQPNEQATVQPTQQSMLPTGGA
jgi:hypothetical protein